VKISVTAAEPGDIPELLASADALVAADAGRHDAAATNLGWAAQAGAVCIPPIAATVNGLHRE
jgi:hypothetical protein